MVTGNVSSDAGAQRVGGYVRSTKFCLFIDIGFESFCAWYVFNTRLCTAVGLNLFYEIPQYEKKGPVFECIICDTVGITL